MKTLRVSTIGATAFFLATVVPAMAETVVQDWNHGVKQYVNDDGSQFCGYVHSTGNKNATLGFKISDNRENHPLEVYYHETGKRWKSGSKGSLKIGYHYPFDAQVYGDQNSGTVGFDVEDKDIERFIAEVRDSSAFRISTPDGVVRTFPVKDAADAISSVRVCAMQMVVNLLVTGMPLPPVL